jgi:hypothetical protein
MTSTIDVSQLNIGNLQTLDLLHLIINKKSNHDVIKECWKYAKTRPIGDNLYHIVKDCVVSEVAIEAFHMLQKRERPIQIDCYKVTNELCAIEIFNYHVARHDNDTLRYIIDTVIISPFFALAVVAIDEYINYDIKITKKVERLIYFCTSRIAININERVVDRAYAALTTECDDSFALNIRQLGEIATKGLFEHVQIQAATRMVKLNDEDLGAFYYVLKNSRIEKIQKLMWTKIKKTLNKKTNNNLKGILELLLSKEVTCSDKIKNEAWTFFITKLTQEGHNLSKYISEGSILSILKYSTVDICDQVWQLSKSLFAKHPYQLSDIYLNAKSEKVRLDAKLIYINIDGIASSDITAMLKKHNKDMIVVKAALKILLQKGRDIADYMSIVSYLLCYGDLNIKDSKYLWKRYLKYEDKKNQNIIGITLNCKHYEVVIEAWNNVKDDYKLIPNHLLDTLKSVQCEEFALHIVNELIDIEELDRGQIQKIAENQFASVVDIGWNALKSDSSFCFKYVHDLARSGTTSTLRNLALEELANDYYSNYQTLYSME